MSKPRMVRAGINLTAENYEYVKSKITNLRAMSKWFNDLVDKDRLGSATPTS